MWRGSGTIMCTTLRIPLCGSWWMHIYRSVVLKECMHIVTARSWALETISQPGYSLMHDDQKPPLSVLELSGDKFDEQPVCWQNMVNKLSQDDEYFHKKFVRSIGKHLAQFHLTYVNNPYPEASLVKGTKEDLMAWILAYS